MQEVEWSGVVIDKEDQVKILQLFDPPAGWSADADRILQKIININKINILKN
jgi:hypothetical protein